MLCVIVISFKVHKAKKTRDKEKNIFIKQEREYIIYTDKMSLPKKKKINCKEIQSIKPWPLEEGELLSSSTGW